MKIQKKVIASAAIADMLRQRMIACRDSDLFRKETDVLKEILRQVEARFPLATKGR